MTKPLAIAVNGAQGRMGLLITALAADDPRFGAIVPYGRASDWSALPEIDVIVDFSTPSGLAMALAAAEARGAALVTGTTGVDASLDARLDAASERIALLRSANFSLGVAVLTRLLQSAAVMLPDWDLDIAEIHHHGKRDAPSGTALALGRAAAAARGVDFDRVMRSDRDGVREPGTIGFASLRVGDVVGEHTAILASAGERLELGHRATDRAIFARGAVEAAAWLAGRGAGSYRLDDVIADKLAGAR